MNLNNTAPLKHRTAARRVTVFSVMLWAAGAVIAFLPMNYHYEIGLTLMAVSFAVYFGAGYYLACDNESCSSE